MLRVEYLIMILECLQRFKKKKLGILIRSLLDYFEICVHLNYDKIQYLYIAL
jgi:hypothetical protein